ncbi:hypothetical protein NBCG_01653 [Nocardioidaceae bacterium Broad-1]|nr:hypothetical protein NBCG_01653 [Nocardioidaceae bacterium Broad-1]
MPTIWNVLLRVEHPERVTNRQFHGLLSRWLEPIAPRALHAQPNPAGSGWKGGQPYAFGGLYREPGVVGLDVKLMLDQLPDALAASLSGEQRIGDQEACRTSAGGRPPSPA